LTEINQTINTPHIEEYPEGDIIIEDGALEGFQGKTINITENTNGGKSDLEVGIDFIYNMREHTVDIAIATVYALLVYALVLWIKSKFKN